MRSESMNGSKWDGMKIPWTLCINSMIFGPENYENYYLFYLISSVGTLVGIGGAAFKIVGNLALAAVGVVFLPIKMGESGEVYPSTKAYVNYQLHLYKERCACPHNGLCA